jgi:hypothetical protein
MVQTMLVKASPKVYGVDLDNELGRLLEPEGIAFQKSNMGSDKLPPTGLRCVFDDGMGWIRDTESDAEVRYVGEFALNDGIPGAVDRAFHVIPAVVQVFLFRC